MNRSFLVLSLLLSGAGVWLLRAQVNTSAIAGIVTDESGSVAPNVEVAAVQEATGLTRKTRTNETGEYVLPQLPPGRYQVTAEAAGFQKTLIRDVTLAIAQRERIDIALKVGQVAEEVTVSAQGAQLIEPDTATLGALSPGVVPAIPPAQGNASFIGSTAQRPDRSILVGGQRESSTSYLLDGIELRNPRVGDTSMNPSLDAIQEFKIQRNFFQAEFGNSPGIINVATKSGSNEWHGSAYELLRNNKMDARNFFSAVPEPFKRNQFGGSLGAPILKEKLFVFGSYEGFRQRLGSVQRGLYPTQKLLSGDF